jgi:hypothetical protein
MNSARGEVRITIGGVTNTHCVTMGALARIEGRLDMVLIEVLQQVQRASYRVALAILEETVIREGDFVEPSDLLGGPKEVADGCLQIFEAAGLMGKPKAAPKRAATATA